MPAVFMPEVGCRYKLVEDWVTDLGWGKRNLVLLRHLKYTGTKKVSLGKYYKYDFTTGRPVLDEAGNYILEEAHANRTVPNPLFRDDNGDMVPVSVTFPQGIVVELSSFRTGYNGKVHMVWMKVVESSDKRYKERVFEVSVADFNGAVLELVE